MKTTDVRVRRAITAMAGGHAVVLTGDPNGDGYLVFAAQAATPRLVAFAVRHTSGYLRVALPGAECERLHLPPMCDRDTTHCVSVDVRGTGTGISASDRAWTIAVPAVRRCVDDHRHHPDRRRRDDCRAVVIPSGQAVSKDHARHCLRRHATYVIPVYSGLCALLSITMSLAASRLVR